MFLLLNVVNGLYQTEVAEFTSVAHAPVEQTLHVSDLTIVKILRNVGRREGKTKQNTCLMLRWILAHANK